MRPQTDSPRVEPAILAVAFILGFFPMAGIVYLKNAAGRLLRNEVGSLDVDYPLSDLDGLNLWYESRLLEEGIEDMTALVNANIVDIILHTRVPVGRLVDWLDQAHLYLHLPPARRPAPRRLPWLRPRTAADTSAGHGAGPSRPIDGTLVRDALRAAGVRNATSLLAATGHYTPVEDEAVIADPAHRGRVNSDAALREHIDSVKCFDQQSLDFWMDRLVDVDVRLDSIVRVLANDTALTPIINWRQWGAQRQEELLTGQGDRDETGSAAGPAPQRPGTGRTGEPAADHYGVTVSYCERVRRS
jgi:hypothetical protein